MLLKDGGDLVPIYKEIIEEKEPGKVEEPPLVEYMSKMKLKNIDPNYILRQLI